MLYFVPADQGWDIDMRTRQTRTSNPYIPRLATGKTDINSASKQKSFQPITLLNTNKDIDVGGQKDLTSGYICPACGEGFNKMFLLDEHIAGHKGQQLYQCQKCDKKFAHRSNLFRHNKLCGSSARFPCPVCNMSFSRKDTVKNHLESVHNKPKYECAICHGTFSSKVDFQHHKMNCPPLFT